MTNCDAFEDENCSDCACNYWTYQGECETNAEYMMAMCPVSCNTFTGYTENCQAFEDVECSDSKCNYWAHIGECKSNADYMEAMCPLACLPEPFRFT